MSSKQRQDPKPLLIFRESFDPGIGLYEAQTYIPVPVTFSHRIFIQNSLHSHHLPAPRLVLSNLA